MDFDFSTRWSANGAGQWILYDLGETVTAQSVELAFFNGASRLAYFSVTLSEDGEKFTEVFNGASSGKTTELELYDFEDKKARYLKITGFGNSQSTWNSITEVRINFAANTSDIESIHQQKCEIIYPQPLIGNVLHLTNSLLENRSWTIKDLAGKKIEAGYLSASKNQIILNQKPAAGTYILSFEGEKSFSVRLMVR